MKNMVMFNITVEPLKIVHLGYITTDSGESITLKEVVEVTYPHPDSPDIATVTNIQVRDVTCMDRKSLDSGPAILIEASNKAARSQVRV